MKKPVIHVTNLFKDFRLGKRSIPVLKGVNLEIREGEYIILFGPSGCGKTTLLNMIAGLDDATSGEVVVDRLNLTGLPRRAVVHHRRRTIGMVFQEFNLISSMTALENVALPLVFDNVPEHVRRIAAVRLLKRLGILDRAAHKPLELSGGEQQRVAIARALVANPKILLVDEPTGNLDTKSAQEVMNIIQEINVQRRKTVILVTHNADYFGYAHRILQMRDGQVVAELQERAYASP